MLGPLEAHLVSTWPKLPKRDNHVYVLIEGCICILNTIYCLRGGGLTIFFIFLKDEFDIQAFENKNDYYPRSFPQTMVEVHEQR